MNSEKIRIKNFQDIDQYYLAKGIIDKLNDSICEYGVAYLSDFYDACEANNLDIPARVYTEFDWGWTELLSDDCIKIGYEEYEAPKFQISNSDDAFMLIWSKNEKETKTKGYYYLELPALKRIWFDY